MERTAVSSSQIKSVGFADGKMHIEFHPGGTVYEYTGPKVEEHYKGLMAAESKGRYFRQNVRYCKDTKYTKLPADPQAPPQS